jgi:hypothetical protein
MKIFNFEIRKAKSPKPRRPGNRTLAKRMENAGFKLVIDRVEAGDPDVTRRLIEKTLGLELPEFDPVKTVVAQYQSSKLVKAMDLYLEKPGVAERLGQQVLEKHLAVDLAPATDANQTTPRMSPIERATERARQFNAYKKEMGIDEGGWRGTLRSVLTPEVVTNLTKLLQVVVASKTAPAVGSADTVEPKVKLEIDGQLPRVSQAEADRITKASPSQTARPDQGIRLNTTPATDRGQKVVDFVGYQFKAADTDVGGLDVNPAVRPLKPSGFRPEPLTPSPN